MGIMLAQGVPFILAQPNKAILNIDNNGPVEDGTFTIALNFNEPFRWKNTKFESIKTFPMRGGSKMPHTIRFNANNNVSWRQTDVVFSGTFNLEETSAKDLLDQYIEKHGGFGVRTWSVEKKGNLKSFNERTGQYEMLTPSSLSDLRSTRFDFRGRIGSERMSPRSGGESSRFRPRGGLRWESWDRRSHVEAVQVVFSGSFEPHSQVEEALEVIAGGHQGPFEVHFL